MLIKIIIRFTTQAAGSIFITAAAAQVESHSRRSYESVGLGYAEGTVSEDFLHEYTPDRQGHVGAATQRKCLEMNLSVFRTYPDTGCNR